MDALVQSTQVGSPRQGPQLPPAHPQTHAIPALKVFCCVSILHLQRAAGLRRAQGCHTSSCVPEHHPSLTGHSIMNAEGYLCYTLWFLLTTREPCKSLDLYQLPAVHRHQSSRTCFENMIMQEQPLQQLKEILSWHSTQLPVSSSGSPLFLQQSLGT